MKDDSSKTWQRQVSQRFTAALDEQVDALDAVTLQRINQARQQALEQRKRRWRPGQWLIPAGSLAALALVAMVIVNLSGKPGAPASADFPDDEALQLLTAQDDLELYRDLDFYLWLDQQDAG